MCLSGSILASASESQTYAPEAAFNFKLIVKGYHQFVRHDDENASVRLCVHECPLFCHHPSLALLPRARS